MSDLVQAMVRSLPTYPVRDGDPFDALHWTLAHEVERLERERATLADQSRRLQHDYEALVTQARAQGWIGWSRVGGAYDVKPCDECEAPARSYHLRACSQALRGIIG